MRGGGKKVREVVDGEEIYGEEMARGDSEVWVENDPFTTDVSNHIIKQGSKSVGVGLVIAVGVAIGSIFLVGSLKKH